MSEMLRSFWGSLQILALPDVFPALHDALAQAHLEVADVRQERGAHEAVPDAVREEHLEGLRAYVGSNSTI